MSRVRRALGLQLLGVVAALALLAALARVYPVMAWVGSAQALVAHLGAAGWVLYPLLFAACNILLLPAGTLAIGSGLFFGLTGGFLINVAGNLIGAVIMVALGRRFGRGWIRRRFLRQPRWAALDEAVGREGWKIIFLSQLLPFAPSSLLNYLFGITRVRFGTALLWSVLGQAPTMFLYAWLGTFAHFGLGLLSGGTHPRAVDYAAWTGGVVLTFAAVTGLTRLVARLRAEAESKATAPAAPVFAPEESKVLEQAF